MPNQTTNQTSNQILPIDKNIYSPKPIRRGAWVLGVDGNNFSWSYTANPQNYRKNERDQLKYPFYQTPDHMKIE